MRLNTLYSERHIVAARAEYKSPSRYGRFLRCRLHGSMVSCSKNRTPFPKKDNKFVIIIDSQEGEIYILLSIKRIILAHPAHFPLLHHHFIQQHALSRVVSRFVTGKERRELAEARAPLCYQRG